jgi:protein TonB
METKKSTTADLERKKIVFTQFGIVFALLITLGAFEYKSYDKRTINFDQRVEEVIQEEIIPITEQKQKPIVPPEAPKQTTVLMIVENDEIVEDELEIDVDVKQNTEIEVYVAPAFHQEQEEEVVETEIFTVVESMPEFPGGEGAMMAFIARNIKYPTFAREGGIQGRVFVNFVVEPSGMVSNVRVLRGIGGGCDEEAVRVVESMPKWTPGKQRGKAVRVSFNLPVRFTLQ